MKYLGGLEYSEEYGGISSWDGGGCGAVGLEARWGEGGVGDLSYVSRGPYDWIRFIEP